MMHKAVIIINIDNDTCVFTDGKVYGDNIECLKYQSSRGEKPNIRLITDERIPVHDNALAGFIHLLDCILRGWDSVEEAQPKNMTWFDALRQMPVELFAGVVFDMCQTEKDEESLKSRLLECFPEEMAPALHLISTGASSLIPGYTPEGSDSSHWDADT